MHVKKTAIVMIRNYDSRISRLVIYPYALLSRDFAAYTCFGGVKMWFIFVCISYLICNYVYLLLHNVFYIIAQPAAYLYRENVWLKKVNGIMFLRIDVLT